MDWKQQQQQREGGGGEDAGTGGSFKEEVGCGKKKKVLWLNGKRKEGRLGWHAQKLGVR